MADASLILLHCPQVLQKEGVLAFTTIEEGEITATRLAQLPHDIDSERVRFLQVTI